MPEQQSTPPHSRTDGRSTPSLGRRTVLKGAGLTAGALWAVPVVQVVTMDSASAASAPPARVQSTGGSVTTHSGSTAALGSRPSTLAYTGTNGDAMFEAAGVGIGALAIGGAAVEWARRKRRTPQHAKP